MLAGWKTLPNEQASGDFVWELTREHNCFLLKNTGSVFSKDPLNLTGSNLRRDSGLAATQAIGIQLNHTTGKWREHKVKKTGTVTNFHLNVKSKKPNTRASLRVRTAKSPKVTLVYSVLPNQSVTQIVRVLKRGLTNYRPDLKTLLARKIRRINKVKRNGVKDYCDQRRKTKKAE